MSKIEEKCKEKGVRLTDQRKIIAKVISDSKETYGSKDHPDVDELHKRATVIDKKISIATVYRTIKLFEESGILIRHDFKEGKSRYEPTTDEHHNHLIDINTGEIVEFVDKDVVGTCTNAIPLRIIEAKNPEKSPTTPPPSA